MRTLIVVDMQKDFIDGALGTKEAVAIVPNVIKKITEYIDNGDNVIFTRDTHNAQYLETNEGKHLPVVHCVYGTEGWEIPKEIDTDACKMFRHVDKGQFGYTGWNRMINNGDEVELIGLCTDICVVSNALIIKALFPENKVSVDASCCAGVTPETHQAALTTMKMCQIEVFGE